MDSLFNLRTYKKVHTYTPTAPPWYAWGGGGGEGEGGYMESLHRVFDMFHYFVIIIFIILYTVNTSGKK